MNLGLAHRFALGLLALLALSGAAFAQGACERYRAELASLNRAGASIRSHEATAQRQRAELSRLVGYYRAIGCEQGSIFYQAPAECGAIAHRIRGLQAGAAALSAQGGADPGAIEARRRQLQSAIAKACDAPREAQRVDQPAEAQAPAATGGSRTVCVRTCDGFFFPLENDPQGRYGSRDLCQALCPNAEVSVYRAPQDGSIEQAVSESGQPYMKLANALRYQKAVDPSCSCRKPGQNWVQALQKAERMIARRSTDVVVTEKTSEQMARVTLTRPKAVSKAKAAEVAKVTPAEAGPAADPESTGSLTRSASLGTPARPRIIAPDKIPVPLANDQGPRVVQEQEPAPTPTPLQ